MCYSNNQILLYDPLINGSDVNQYLTCTCVDPFEILYSSGLIKHTVCLRLGAISTQV